MSDAKARIVVVDDEPTIAAWTGRALSATGFHVRTLHTGAALRMLLRKEPEWPELILLDLNLPDALGTDIYHEFSELGTRWLVMTGNVNLPELHSLPEEGPKVLAKPFRANALRRAVADVLGLAA